MKTLVASHVNVIVSYVDTSRSAQLITETNFAQVRRVGYVYNAKAAIPSSHVSIMPNYLNSERRARVTVETHFVRVPGI